MINNSEANEQNYEGTVKENPKAKKKKITKQVTEERLIVAYLKDVDVMESDMKKSRLDVEIFKCKKCELKIHSEGLLRRHKVIVHDGNETKQNMILGFKSDMQNYLKLLESMGEGVDKFKCKECIFKTFSEGKLELHKLTKNQENLALSVDRDYSVLY